MKVRALIPIVCMAAIVSACSGGGMETAPNPAVPPTNGSSTMPQSTLSTNTTTSSVSILQQLIHIKVVGSTVDPATGDLNPYGLDVAKITSGKISAGDLVVCNFNNSSNIQGTGNSIIALHPALLSKPRSIVHAASLLGCNALAMAPSGPIWAAAFASNDNPIFSSAGQLLSHLTGGPWNHPFGEAFVPPVNSISVPAFYVSNAGDGSLVRVYVYPGPNFRFATIATGFPINGGPPGGILGPSGLNYQPNGDRLYVVDGQNNALYAIDNVSKVPAGGIKVNGLTFSGMFAGSAHVIFHGAPLNGPISSALLFNGNIVLGNTLDPNGKNLMVEISPTGQMLFVKNVDAGAAGSLFGMVATGTSMATTKLYFNDDNANELWVLQP